MNPDNCPYGAVRNYREIDKIPHVTKFVNFIGSRGDLCVVFPINILPVCAPVRSVDIYWMCASKDGTWKFHKDVSSTESARNTMSGMSNHI